MAKKRAEKPCVSSTAYSPPEPELELDSLPSSVCCFVLDRCGSHWQRACPSQLLGASGWAFPTQAVLLELAFNQVGPYLLHIFFLYMSFFFSFFCWAPELQKENINLLLTESHLGAVQEALQSLVSLNAADLHFNVLKREHFIAFLFSI